MRAFRRIEVGESAARAKAAGAPEFRPFFLSSYLLHASVWLPSPSHSSPRTGRGHFPQVHSRVSPSSASVDPLFAGNARQTEHCADASGTSGPGGRRRFGRLRARLRRGTRERYSTRSSVPLGHCYSYSTRSWSRSQGSARTYATEKDVGEREMAPPWLRPGSDMFGWAVFRCENFAKSEVEKHCSTFRLYVVNIVLPWAN